MNLIDQTLEAFDTALIPADPIVTSEIPGVSDEQWTAFVSACITARLSEVNESNQLGMFAMTPRRLADLGLINNLKCCKSPKSGRTVYAGDFILPLTADKFLKSPAMQYKVFATSMKNYVDQILDGSIEKTDDMSLSGALALLHRAGPNALVMWKKGERFAATETVFLCANGLF